VNDQLRTALLWDERTMWHEPSMARALNDYKFFEPYEHWENVATKRRLFNLVEASGLLRLLDRPEVRGAETADLERVHDPSYVDHIKSLNSTGGNAGDNATFGPGGYDLALSAGASITAVDIVLRAGARNAYVLSRPPGHHAEPAFGRGFCIFGNVAIAARYAQVVHGINRIAIVDWDVHHGNGTQSAFYVDPGVLTMSVHQERCFPFDTGDVVEAGEGPGLGFNINVPLPAGCTNETYFEVFDRIVLPALSYYRPELIIIANGLDANLFDPLANMMLDSEGFRALTRLVSQAADTLCEGRIVVCHEGGYSPIYVPFCGLAVVEELVGVSTEVVDPLIADASAVASRPSLPHHREAIDIAFQALDLKSLGPSECSYRESVDMCRGRRRKAPK